MRTKPNFLITMLISATVAALFFAYSAPTQGSGAALPSSTSAEGVYIILAAGGPGGNTNDTGKDAKDAKTVVVDPQDPQAAKHGGVFPGATVQGEQGHVNSGTGDYPTGSGDTANASTAKAPLQPVPVPIHRR
jgi:hypothetical protein